MKLGCVVDYGLPILNSLGLGNGAWMRIMRLNIFKKEEKGPEGSHDLPFVACMFTFVIEPSILVQINLAVDENALENKYFTDINILKFKSNK